MTQQFDHINHPAHYSAGGLYETIRVIEAWGLGFRLGNVLKYISREGKKDGNPLDDLRKARWYLDREISYREQQEFAAKATAGSGEQL